MEGTRPLDNSEIRRVSAYFSGKFEVRNRGLFMLGVSTGGRISELLSLTIGDVYQNAAFVGFIETMTDENILLELKRRGYDLSRLRDDETDAPAEIVKIS